MCDTVGWMVGQNASEFDQEMPQSQTVDQPTTPLGKDTKDRYPQHKVKQPAHSDC